MPADVYLSPDDRLLLVGLTGDKAVEVYDVSGSAPKLVKRIETGDGAHAFRAAGDLRHVFVSNRVANTISKIDLQTLAVVANYPAPGGPDCMDVLADGKTLLVTSRWSRKLTFIDTETRQVIRQVNVGRSPHGVWTSTMRRVDRIRRALSVVLAGAFAAGPAPAAGTGDAAPAAPPTNRST